MEHNILNEKHKLWFLLNLFYFPVLQHISFTSTSKKALTPGCSKINLLFALRKFAIEGVFH